LLVSHEHPLYQLAEAIDWSRFKAKLGPLYAEAVRRPGLPTRLMVGLPYLKYLFDESDESVVERWVEYPYWQFFCGRIYFEHELPCHPTSLVRWRQRLGAAGVEKLLTETLSTAKREQALRDSEIKRVHVDTTVQEKAIAFPTDARLYHKARRTLVRAATAAGINLRQSYVRLVVLRKYFEARRGRIVNSVMRRHQRGLRRTSPDLPRPSRLIS
jgi:IS5 family transposase